MGWTKAQMTMHFTFLLLVVYLVTLGSERPIPGTEQLTIYIDGCTLYWVGMHDEAYFLSFANYNISTQTRAPYHKLIALHNTNKLNNRRCLLVRVLLPALTTTSCPQERKVYCTTHQPASRTYFNPVSATVHETMGTPPTAAITFMFWYCFEPSDGSLRRAFISPEKSI